MSNKTMILSMISIAMVFTHLVGYADADLSYQHPSLASSAYQGTASDPYATNTGATYYDGGVVAAQPQAAAVGLQQQGSIQQSTTAQVMALGIGKKTPLRGNTGVIPPKMQMSFGSAQSGGAPGLPVDWTKLEAPLFMSADAAVVDPNGDAIGTLSTGDQSSAYQGLEDAATGLDARAPAAQHRCVEMAGDCVFTQPHAHESGDPSNCCANLECTWSTMHDVTACF